MKRALKPEWRTAVVYEIGDLTEAETLRARGPTAAQQLAVDPAVPAWTRLPASDGGTEPEWYLHLLAPEQRDLNWQNLP